jgi:hypothetical protein
MSNRRMLVTPAFSKSPRRRPWKKNVKLIGGTVSWYNRPSVASEWRSSNMRAITKMWQNVAMRAEMTFGYQDRSTQRAYERFLNRIPRFIFQHDWTEEHLCD